MRYDLRAALKRSNTDYIILAETFFYIISGFNSVQVPLPAHELDIAVALGSASGAGQCSASGAGQRCMGSGALASASGAGQRWAALGSATSGQRWAALGSGDSASGAGQRWAALLSADQR